MSTKNITTIINKTAISAEYECEYYHPVHDEQIYVAPTKTLEVNGEEVGKIHMYLLDPTWFTKLESTLFVSTNLSFSENLRCLNLPLLVGAVSQKRLLS